MSKSVVKPPTDPMDFSTVFKKPDSENQSSERLETLKQVVSELFSINEVSTRSDISSNQLLPLVKGQLFGEHYKNALVLGLVNGIFKVSFSLNRKSRKEMIESFKGLVGSIEPQLQPQSLADRFLGERR